MIFVDFFSLVYEIYEIKYNYNFIASSFYVSFKSTLSTNKGAVHYSFHTIMINFSLSDFEVNDKITYSNNQS
jgi:hypothetical protein